MDMKIPICLICKTPLKIKGTFAKFRCMCDEEIRSLFVEGFHDNELIICLDSKIDENIVSEVFLKDWLTISKKLIN
jgi:hypothetical protein